MSTTFLPHAELDAGALLGGADQRAADPVIAAVSLSEANARHAPLLQLAAQVMRFGTVGGLGFLWDYATFTALSPLLGLHLAALASFLVAATMNWLLNRLWTFRHCRCASSAFRQWLTFLGANSFGFLLNRSTMFLLVAEVPLCATHPVLALAAGSLAGLFANFGMSRRLVFRDSAVRA